MASERDFIRRLQLRFPATSPVETGIGDDGAVLKASNRRTVVVTDMLLDGVHFDLRTTSALLVGRKVIAVNLSDLAAMGCRPTAAFVSIAVPQAIADRDQFMTQLYDGVEEILQQHRCGLAGGDTNSWNGPFAINVCLTGEPFGDECFLRSSARAGDDLFVTGPLGGSLLSERHLTFEPRLDVAAWLSSLRHRIAAMDISDGLAIDLHRMMEASGAGAVLDADSIPVHDDVPNEWPASERLQAALSDGEDFELLISVDRKAGASLVRDAEVHGFKLWRIGSVGSSSGVRIKSQSGTVPLDPIGWQH